MSAPRFRSTQTMYGWLACAMVALSVALPAPCGADYAGRLGITAGAGAAKFVGGLYDHAAADGIYHAGFRFGYTQRFDVEAGLRYHSFKPATIPADTVFRNESTQVEFGLLFNLWPEKSWTPQAWLNAGVLFWQVQGFSPNASSGLFADGQTARGFDADGSPKTLTDANFTLGFGLGSEFRLTRHASFRVGARIDWLPAQELDNTGASAAFRDPVENPRHADANDYLPSAFAAVTWFFSQRDGDGDGLPDEDDPCPYDAEDVDGFEDTDGCPDLDNDKDNVADNLDNCPDEAEDVDGFEDDDGCPDPDNDGDGVEDTRDRCPDEAEDNDGYQDSDGCPDPDNDGDGVLDGADACDGTPAGVRVDSQGCPLALRIEGETLVQGLRFARNSEQIQEGFAALDSLAERLIAYPDTKVEVHAHTNSIGSSDNNLLLSQRRAEAVVGYLSQRGVPADRMLALGFGEENPIDSNETEAGRARNERVVIVPAAGIEGLDEP